MPSLGGCFGPTSSVRDFDIYIGRTKLEYHDDILPAIFMSHRGLAKALGEYGFFLDIDPEGGTQAGSRWEAVPYSNLIRSHAVIARHSEHWKNSRWCFAEITHAKLLGRAVIPVSGGM